GLMARKALLEEQGLEVTTSLNGEDAVETLSRKDFDLLVTDFKMPKMNGVELIRRARERRPAIAVILLSGFVDSFGLDERSTGADLVISKGAREVPQLLGATIRLLARKTPRRPTASAGKTKLKAKGQSC